MSEQFGKQLGGCNIVILRREAWIWGIAMGNQSNNVTVSMLCV